MNEIASTENIKVENMIYEVRGKQIILSSDVATIYKVETKVVNQTIRRNINRFPIEFCFQLTREETALLSLRSQFVTLNNKNNMRGQHYKYLPYVLTEQGIMMLSGLLKSEIAVEVNIKIINAFVVMKRYISNNLIEKQYYNNMVLKHDEDIKLLQESFYKLSLKEKNNHIFYDGQIYDAYSKIIDVLNTSKKEVVIVDNYLDKNMLDIISKCKTKVLLITANKLDNIDLLKYNKQYNNLHIKINYKFHDRFIIIDRSILYHLGSSLNSIGNKCFAINKIDDENILIELIKKLEL